MVTDAMVVMASQYISVSYEPHCTPQTYTMSCVTYLNKAGIKYPVLSWLSHQEVERDDASLEACSQEAL